MLNVIKTSLTNYAYGDELKRARSTGLFRKIQMHILKNRKLYGIYDSYSNFFLNFGFKIIYNDYVCIGHDDEFPNMMMIFVSDSGLKNPKIGASIIDELNTIVTEYDIKTISLSSILVLREIPYEAYYKIISSILYWTPHRCDNRKKSDIVYLKTKKIIPRTPKYKPPEKYDVEYFPVLANPIYAFVYNSIIHINIEWAHTVFTVDVTGMSEYYRDKQRIRLYSELRDAIINMKADKFIKICEKICAFHYILTNECNLEEKDVNSIITPFDIDNSVKFLYQIKALIAKLHNKERPVFEYIMKTKIFNDVEYDYHTYDWYMMRYNHTDEDKYVWGVYDPDEPRWSSEYSYGSSHRVMFSDNSMEKSFNDLMKDCYRRDIYDENTYAEYYNNSVYERDYIW